MSAIADDGYAERDWGIYLPFVSTLAGASAVLGGMVLVLQVTRRVSTWYAALPEPE